MVCLSPDGCACTCGVPHGCDPLHELRGWDINPVYINFETGFTFLMDANTAKYFYNYFMGMKKALISH